ncbi:MAG: AAA family ATPase [Achromobacter sp.]|uniref:AAA family ATPase n=1 Tax=Achromobacter sp. TaxID=134375 RepID=UPI003D04DE63
MRLLKAQVQNYRSVEDSGVFDIGDLTSLVGKNEAGKTAILSALRALRPSESQAFEIDETIDYPRRFSTRFDERHPDGEAEVIRTWWKLDAADLAAVENRFGPKALRSDIFEVHYGFRYKGRQWEIDVDHAKCLEYLVSSHSLDATDRNILHNVPDGPKAAAALGGLAQPSAKQTALLEDIKKLRKSSFSLGIIDILEARQPRFFFTSHFERMSGMVSLNQLQKDKEQGKVDIGDKIFLSFLEYAGTTLDELISADRREALKAKCEAASNEITEEIFQFWSQNNALEVVIEIDSGKPSDPPPFNQGVVADIRIRNTNHKATLPLSERSAGFVWFFSFLAQFKQLKKTERNAIILLDEPGLTLHGKAQGDLLRYIVERLLPDHQVIFTTHSPFMVPMDRLADVRIVEDVILFNQRTGRPELKGTKIHSDVLEVSDDTLFPLQGALGYEITQSMFIGSHTWLVEGPSDILYLQTLSQALHRRNREGMDRRWTLCPSGGIDKIAPFVRLFGGNHIDIAVLSDVANTDRKKIEAVKKEQILKAGRFFTAADFVGQQEADVEDIFDPELFSEILNGAYKPPVDKTVSKESLLAAADTERIIKKAEALFKLMPADVAEFDHFAPARWLLENPDVLDRDSKAVLDTLDRAEAVFNKFNSLLS